MGCRREHQHVICVRRQLASELMTSNLVGATSDMVGFVENHQIPTGLYHRLEALSVVGLKTIQGPSGTATHRFYGVQRTDDPVESPPGIDPSVNGDTARTHSRELLVEAVAHLSD